MARLKDIHLCDVPKGSLVYPSSGARTSGRGGYNVYLEKGIQNVPDDSQLFPGVLIDPKKGTMVTPTGIKSIGPYCLVSVLK